METNTLRKHFDYLIQCTKELQLSTRFLSRYKKRYEEIFPILHRKPSRYFYISVCNGLLQIEMSIPCLTEDELRRIFEQIDLSMDKERRNNAIFLISLRIRKSPFNIFQWLPAKIHGESLYQACRLGWEILSCVAEVNYEE